jgi:hypothetical protein
MKSRTTPHFRKLFAALPSHVQAQARQAYRLFCLNPHHPGLHFKKVFDDPPTFSTRAGIGYRAIGALDGDTMIWYWIGSHADYDKLLAQM